VSELTILKAAIDQGRMGIAAAYLGLLAVVFTAMTSVALRMAQGEVPDRKAQTILHTESWLAVTPPAALAAGAALLGVYIPAPLWAVVQQAAQVLGYDG
jgi:hydrogenase-4 component F